MLPKHSTIASTECTIPITSAEEERSFSLVRRIKTHLRNRMNESRLSSLSLMAMHYDVHFDIRTIVKRFNQKHPTHPKFVAITCRYNSAAPYDCLARILHVILL